MTDTMQGLNKEQLDAVQTINGPMLILAGAGSAHSSRRPHERRHCVKIMLCNALPAVLRICCSRAYVPIAFWRLPLPIKPPRKCASV